MDSGNNEGDNAPTRHLKPSRKTSNAKNRLHFIEYLAKWCLSLRRSGDKFPHLRYFQLICSGEGKSAFPNGFSPNAPTTLQCRPEFHE